MAGGCLALGEGVRFHCQPTRATSATLSEQLTFSREQTFSSCPFITRQFGGIKQNNSNQEYLHLRMTKKKSFRALSVSKVNFVLLEDTIPTIMFGLPAFFYPHRTGKFGEHPSTIIVFSRLYNFSFHSCSLENYLTVTAEQTHQGLSKQSHTGIKPRPLLM